MSNFGFTGKEVIDRQKKQISSLEEYVKGLEAENERLRWMLDEGQKRYADSRWWADLESRWTRRQQP